MSNGNGGGSGGLALNVGSETRRTIQPERGLELKAEAGQNKVQSKAQGTTWEPRGAQDPKRGTAGATVCVPGAWVRPGLCTAI